MEALGVINTTVAPYITNAINSESIRHIDQSTYIVFIQVLFLFMEGVINTTVAPYITKAIYIRSIRHIDQSTYTGQIKLGIKHFPCNFYKILNVVLLNFLWDHFL